MNRNGAAASNATGNRTGDLQHIGPVFRHTTVWNRKGQKFDPARSAKLSFALQSKLGNLIAFEKAYDHIQTGSLPFTDLGLQPIVSAGPS
jgi:hypothetical protein